MDKNDLNKIGLASENISEMAEGIEERLEDIKNKTTEFVKEHPLTSLAIAAGVGYLIAKLLSGRRS